MKPSQALQGNRVAIREVAYKHNTTNPRVFGSVLHGVDSEKSDLDLLVDRTATTSLFDIVRIKFELEELLGVEVDVLTPDSLHENFRDSVLAEAAPV